MGCFWFNVLLGVYCVRMEICLLGLFIIVKFEWLFWGYFFGMNRNMGCVLIWYDMERFVGRGLNSGMYVLLYESSLSKS